MTIKQKIINLFNEEKELTVKELVLKTQASKQMIHIVLKKLTEERKIQKLGKVPKTVYRLISSEERAQNTLPSISHYQETFLQEHFLQISEIGELQTGIEAFNNWCIKRNQPVLKTLNEYILTKEKYDRYFDENNMINGTIKLEKTYGKDCFLKEIYYLDFYAIERFGKTRLGLLLHFAKQGQNKYLMNILITEIKNKVLKFVELNKFDAVLYVPATIRRELQIMDFIKEHLNISLPKIEIIKVSGIIPVPQKSLSKIDERINNAKKTFAILEQRRFKKILMIDDAVGSGATLNFIAEKILNKKVTKQIYGIAIVGSFKGFDVITDI